MHSGRPDTTNGGDPRLPGTVAGALPGVEVVGSSGVLLGDNAIGGLIGPQCSPAPVAAAERISAALADAATSLANPVNVFTAAKSINLIVSDIVADQHLIADAAVWTLRGDEIFSLTPTAAQHTTLPPSPEADFSYFIPIAQSCTSR